MTGVISIVFGVVAVFWHRRQSGALLLGNGQVLMDQTKLLLEGELLAVALAVLVYPLQHLSRPRKDEKVR